MQESANKTKKKLQADSVHSVLISLILFLSILVAFGSAFMIFVELFAPNGTWASVSKYYLLGYFNPIYVIPILYIKYKKYGFHQAIKILFILLSIIALIPVFAILLTFIN